MSGRRKYLPHGLKAKGRERRTTTRSRRALQELLHGTEVACVSGTPPVLLHTCPLRHTTYNIDPVKKIIQGRDGDGFRSPMR